MKESISREDLIARDLISRDSQQSLVIYQSNVSIDKVNSSSSNRLSIICIIYQQISLKEDPQFVMGPPVESILKNEEKRYLLLVERGDFNGVRRLVFPPTIVNSL